MNKQPEITAQTRQNLMDAFWQIYCKKGIEKITVKEVTAKAGYNRSTFYEYFTDVYDVLEKIENSLLLGPQNIPPLILAENDSNLEPIDTFINIFEQNRKYYTILLGDNGDSSFQSKIKRAIKEILKRKLISQGLIDNYELDFTLEYTLSAMIGVLNYWFSLEVTPPRDKLLELIYELTHKGVTHKLVGNHILGTKEQMFK
jgi:AcrR family transcriptional regulator